MNDFQGQESFFTRDKTQYRFVYQRTRNEKIALWGSVLIGALSMAIIFYAKEEWQKEWLFLLFLGVQTGLLVLQGFIQQSLLIGPEGVRQQWKTGPFAFSRHLAWQEIEKIQLGYSITAMGVTRKGIRCFWFFGRWDELKRQLVFIRDDMQVYVGEGHTLSLLQAIEKFHAVAQPSKEEWGKNTQRQAETLVIDGKEVQVIAFAAIVLALLLVTLIPFAHARALETTESHRIYMFFYFVVGFIAFLAACVYTRRDLPLPLFLNVLFGGLCGFLMVPLIDASPAWLSEGRQEAFAIVREDNRAQYWQGTTSPDLVFTLFLGPGERAHQGVGTSQTFTIYRGPFGLVSMEREEFRALFNPDRR